MKVKSKLKKLLERDGYVRVRNVLNFSKDLKPILNDMEFVMDCLIRKYAPKTKKDNAPIINASKPPGEWQKFIVVFRAPRFDVDGNKLENAKFVKVIHNGQLIHKDIEVGGATKGARYNDEKSIGPLMLQGDHGPVAYRRIIFKPIKLD